MTLDEYARFVAQTTSVIWAAGIPWEVSRRVMKPLALPHAIGPVERNVVRRAMQEHGATMAYWPQEWDRSPSSWWYVICDMPDYSIERLSSNGRRDVRASLRRCQIRQVEPGWIAEHGYSVYAAATSRYEGVKAVSEEEFRRGYQARQGLEGFCFYGAFLQGQLVAYLSCIVIDDVALSSAMKSHPDFLKELPNNGLVFEFTRHFLRDRHMRYCYNGHRNVVHQTSMHDFLIKRLGYRRSYCRLCVEMRPALSLAVKSGLGRWGRHLGLSRLAPGALQGLQAATLLSCLAAHPDAEVADAGVANASGSPPGSQ